MFIIKYVRIYIIRLIWDVFLQLNMLLIEIMLTMPICIGHEGRSGHHPDGRAAGAWATGGV